jgi:PAS domain S-box-containing protein
MTVPHQPVRLFKNIYERILYSLPDLIFVFDEKANFLEFYCEDQSALYVKPQNFFGKNISDSGLPEHVIKTTKTIIKKVVLTKKDFAFQYTLDFQPEEKYFDARFFYLEANKVFAIIRDISTIKKSELNQKELKKYYQEILNRLDRAIAETNKEWTIQYVNNAFYEMTGIEKKELKKKNFFEHLRLSQDKADAFFNKKKGKKNLFVFETISITSEKRYLKISIAQTICKSSGEQLYNIDIDDITEERKKREVLEKNEQTYRNLVETSPNGIIIRDETKILFANYSAIKILGFKDLDHAKNYKLEDLYLPEYSRQIIERIADVAAGLNVPYLELKIKRPIDGQIIEVETIPVRIYYDGKEAYQIVIKDVSLEKKLLETKLRADIAEESYLKLRQEIVIRQEMEQELSRSLEEKSLLLKEVHHRVKNNLQIISSILNLEIRSQKKQDVGQALKRIQNRINSIYLVHEIVYQTDMFSRIDLGQYIKLISENLIRTSHLPDKKFSYALDDVFVTLDIAVPIGMILNEIFYNYFEYITDFERKNKLQINLKRKTNTIEIKITYPKRLILESAEKTPETTLSAQLIDALTDQINGVYKVEKENQNNSIFVLNF